MATINYNNVHLPFPAFTDFKQKSVRDPSGTDRILTEFNIQVQCVIHADYIPMLAPDLTSSSGPIRNPADIMGVIRDRLLQQRRRLSVQFNGVELIPQAAGDVPGTVDAKNGPIPGDCVITDMTNETFLLTWSVIANYWECNSDVNADDSPAVKNNPGNEVLYNRWSESVDIDKCNFTKRIREGRFQIRSDNITGSISDMLRSQMAVLGVPTGFLRDSSNYTQSEDGLTLQYRVEDREVYKMPPQFVDGSGGTAFTAQGEYIESTTHWGTQRWGECHVRLEGDKFNGIHTQAKLVQTAVAVVMRKLRINGSMTTSKGYTMLEHGAIKVGMYDNYVEVQAKARMKPRTFVGAGTPAAATKGRKYGVWGFDYENMVTTPLSDTPNDVGSFPRTPDYLDRGTAGLLLQAAAYYDPCLRTNKLNRNTTGQMQQGLVVGQAGLTNEATSTNTPDPAAAHYANVPGLTNPYTGEQIIPTLTVLTANIPPDDTAARYLDLSPDLEMFRDYVIDLHTERDGHIYMMGVGSPNGTTGGDAAAFVQLALPTQLMIADWTASKSLDVPEIPNPYPISANSPWVLMDLWYSLPDMKLAPDGITPVYRVTGTYVYGCKRPSNEMLNDLRFPRPPWFDATGVFRGISISAFTPTVLGLAGEF